MVRNLKVSVIFRTRKNQIYRNQTISVKNNNSLISFIKIASSFQKIANQSGPAASASYSMIGSILIFTFIGRYIDMEYGLSPAFTLSGLFFGLSVGFYGLFKVYYLQKNKLK